MEAQEMYGLSREEFVRLRGILCELLRQQFTQQHRITPTSIGDLVRSLDYVNAAIRKYDVKPPGRPKKEGGDE